MRAHETMSLQLAHVPPSLSPSTTVLGENESMETGVGSQIITENYTVDDERSSFTVRIEE